MSDQADLVRTATNANNSSARLVNAVHPPSWEQVSLDQEVGRRRLTQASTNRSSRSPYRGRFLSCSSSRTMSVISAGSSGPSGSCSMLTRTSSSRTSITVTMIVLPNAMLSHRRKRAGVDGAGLRVTKKALAQKEDEGRMTHVEIRTAPRQVVSGSVKQCPLWAYLASQSCVVRQDAELP